MAKLTVNGPALLAARRRIGLRQHELAARANVTPARLRVLEHGGAGAQLRTIAKLAAAVGAEPFELLEWDPEGD